MSIYEDVVARAVAVSIQPLDRESQLPEGASSLLELTPDASFVGLVGFLASGAGRTGGAWPEISFAEGAESAIHALEDLLPERDRSRLKVSLASGLKRMFRNGKRPSAILREKPFSDRLVAEGLSQLGKQAGVTLTPEQLQECVALLGSGQAFRDLAAVTAAVYWAVPGFAQAVDRQLRDPATPVQVVRLGEAIAADAVATPIDTVHALGELVRTKRRPEAPRVLSRTLARLYEIAPAAQTFALIRELLARNNRSMRLALILYAGANGVSITDEDIDAVRDAFDPDDPNLGGLAAPAIRQLLSRYGKDAGKDVLKQLLAKKP